METALEVRGLNYTSSLNFEKRTSLFANMQTSVTIKCNKFLLMTELINFKEKMFWGTVTFGIISEK